jgi:hypothetical protein
VNTAAFHAGTPCSVIACQPSQQHSLRHLQAVLPAVLFAFALKKPWHHCNLISLQGESRPVRLPLTQSSQAMPLFSALTVESASCEVTADPAEPPQQYTFNVDTVLYAGGPVWSTAWCPLHNSEDATAGPLQTVETLAVSTHPRTQRRNPIGMQHTGPGLVQLWGVPSSAESQLLPGGLPQLLALLWHDGRVCWDLAWCPDPSAFIPPSSNSTGSSSSSSTGGMPAAQQAVPLQGLLAAVLGNGDVIVWAVPTIAYLLEVAEEAGVSAASAPQQQQQQQDLQQPVQPLSLQLTPLMQLPCSAVGGSMASCCSWLPATPHDQLLVGCWDGNVAIWQLPTTAGGLGSRTCFLLVCVSSDYRYTFKFEAGTRQLTPANPCKHIMPEPCWGLVVSERDSCCGAL